MSSAKRPQTKEEKALARKAVETREPQIRTLPNSKPDPKASFKQDRNDPTAATLTDKSTEYRKELESIFALITDSNTSAARREAIINELPDDVITDLRTMHNVYKKPVFIGDDYKVLTFSMTNMTQKYQQRFAVTSFIAFIFQMLKEYDPAASKSYPSENEPKFVAAYQAKIQEYERRKPMEDLEREWREVTQQIELLRAAEKIPEPPSEKTAEKVAEAASDGTPEKNLNRISEKPSPSPSPSPSSSPSSNQDPTQHSPTPAPKPSIPNMVELIRQTFLIRGRMIRFQQFYLNKDLTSVIDTREALEREVRNAELEDQRQHRSTEIMRIKLQKRRLMDEGHTEEIQRLEQDTYGAHRRRIVELQRELTAKGVKLELNTMPPDMQAMHARMMEENLTPEDVKLTVSLWEAKLSDAETRSQRSAERLQAQRTRLENAIQQEAVLRQSLEDYAKHFTALHRDYDSHFRRTADLIRKRAAEFVHGKHPLDDIEVERYNLTEAEYDQLARDTKLELGIAKTAEEHTDEVRETIESFLLEYLKYDPTNHVSCSYYPNHAPHDKRPKTGAEIEALRRETMIQHGRNLIPPDDTFYRFNRYMENHYEALRQATDDIYPEVSDVELAIVPYRVFEGSDPKRVDEEVREFQRKYAPEVEADILAVRFGIWSLLGPWERNRELRDFYSKETEIMRRIIQKNEEDAKIGNRINKSRQEKKKRENIQEHGADAEGLDMVKRSTGQALQKYGAKPHVLGDPIGRDDRPSTKDEIEVGVTRLAPALVGKRRIRTRPDGWKLHIPTEPLKEGQMQMHRPSEFQKDLMEREAKGLD